MAEGGNDDVAGEPAGPATVAAMAEGGHDDITGEPAGPATVATGDDLRIVSLLPSLTDIVAELGLAERVVGVTHECDNGLVLKRAGKGPVVVTESFIDPKAEQKEINDAVIESLAQNHSLYALKEDSLRPLAPTHVLTQSLCDVCAVAFEQVKSKCSRLLADKPYKLLSVEPSTLQDVQESITLVGNNLGASREAIDAALNRFDTKKAAIEAAVEEHLSQVGFGGEKPRVAVLEWCEPMFTGGHWIQEMVEAAGGSYSLAKKGERSRVMSQEELKEYDPDVIVMAFCGFDLERCEADTRKILMDQQGEHYAWWSQLRAVRDGRVFCTDGNQYFSRPSHQLVDGIGILAQVMHGVPRQDASERRWTRLTL